MSKVCDKCGKHPVAGKTVTHAHNVNKRTYYPNLRTIKINEGGAIKKMKVCMRCLKTITKA
ncbi:MAG: 50S ribosomal protein L28 [Chitinivibrionales bacterium]|nr:50S ribosomal protein L28 [Chitinivibrionales bacterium]